jgi:hypothetical protein
MAAAGRVPSGTGAIASATEEVRMDEIDLFDWAAGVLASVTQPEPEPLIKVGDRVISWHVRNEDGATWQGPGDDPRFVQWGMGVFSGELPTLKCEMADVAPYGTPLADAKDPRIVVVKGKKPGPWYPGNWNLQIRYGDRVFNDWFRTKGDGVNKGRSVLAVLDWHDAAAEAATDQWKPLVDAMSG